MTSPALEKTLGELVTLQNEKIFANKKIELPYIGLEHIASGIPRLLGVAESGSSVSVNSVFKKDDILFGKLRPNLRKSLRAPFPGYCSTDILVLRCLPNVMPAFAGHVLQWERVFSAASATATGTKMPRASWNDLSRLPVFLPESIAEQSRVAAILDAVAKQIAQTHVELQKVEQIRTGLLRDLLTLGLDKNGERRDPNAHPEQFKDGPVGRIPETWAVKSLRDCLSESPQNGIYKPPSMIGYGTLLIGQTSIREDRFLNIDLARRASISIDELHRYGIQNGDILVSRVFATLSGVGQPAFVSNLYEPAVYESNMMRLRTRPESILPILLFHWLQHERTRRLLLSRVNLSTQASVNQYALNHLPITIPRHDEQKAMVQCIETINEQQKATLADQNKLMGI